MDAIMRDLKRLKPEESAADNENILEIDRQKQRDTLATWIAAAELPLTTGQRPAFGMFLTELNPLWKEVTPKMVMSDMINIFHKIKKELIADIPKTSRGVSFSASTWTGAHGHGFTYICFSAHFVDPKTWELNKRTIAFRPLEFDDDYVYRCAVELLREFNLTQCCFGITFDNSEFNETSIPYFTREFKPECYRGELFHLRCATDVINEIVKIGLEEFAPYVTKVRDANVFIASSDRFEEYCEMCRARNLKPKRIVPDWPARWDTTYLMLQNCIGYEEVITSFYESGMEAAKKTLGEDETLDMSETLEPHVWEAARSFCSFLEAFEKAIRTLSSVYDPTMCVALECVYEMSLALRTARENEVFKNVITRMDAEFKKYWFKIPMLYALGAIMDPRIRLDGVGAALEAIKTNMGWTEVGVKKDEIEKVLVDLYNSYDAKHESGDTEMEGSFEAPPGSFWAVIRATQEKKTTTRATQEKNELKKYLEADFRKIEGTAWFDILAWWEENRVIFPVLSKMARHILATPVSTISLEKAFFTTGKVMSELRTNMPYKVLEAAVVIQDTTKAPGRTQGAMDDAITESFENLEDLEFEPL